MSFQTFSFLAFLKCSTGNIDAVIQSEKLIFKIPYIIISFQDKFENINNVKYFNKIKKKLDEKGYKTLISSLEHYNNAFLNTNKHFYLFAKRN